MRSMRTICVFISATPNLGREENALVQALNGLDNVKAVSWQSLGGVSDRTRGRQKIAVCDLFIGMVGLDDSAACLEDYRDACTHGSACRIYTYGGVELPTNGIRTEDLAWTFHSVEQLIVACATDLHNLIPQ